MSTALLRIAALFVCCACAHLPAFGGAESWVEYTSEHFTVRTPLAEPAARELVATLEGYRAAMGLAMGANLPTTSRLKVVAFSETGALQRLGWPDSVAGFFRSDGPLVGLQPTKALVSTPVGPVQAHELAHYFMAFLFRSPPRWFAEGMADYLGSVAVDASAGKAILGRANLMRVGDARNPLTLEQLWEWGHLRETLSETPEQAARNYASAWLWVHFLLNAYPERFLAFMQGLALGQAPKLAFARAFVGVSSVTLNQQVGDYTRMDQRYEVFTLSLPARSEEVTARPMTPPEVLWARYEVSTAEEVDAQLEREAAQRFPGSAEALLLAAQRANPPSPAAELALLAAYPEEPRVVRHLADRCALLPAGSCESLTARAVALAPDDAWVLQARLQWLSSRGASADEVLGLLRRLVQVAPFSVGALTAAATVLAALGKCPDAQAVGARAAGLLSEGYSAKVQKEARAALARGLSSCGENGAPPSSATQGEGAPSSR